MVKRVLIDKGVIFTRVAVISDDSLKAVYLNSNFEDTLHNCVVIGEVKDIVKNLDAVFVDFGLDKNGLLHMNKIPPEYKQKLYQGRRIAVQILKENEGEKGHKLTAFINLVGKHLVCLPFETGIGVSKNIKEDSKRKAIQKVIAEVSNNKYGFIARTSCADALEEEIKNDAYRLVQKAEDILNKKDKLSKGTVIYKNDPLYIQVIKELVHEKEPIEVVCNAQEIFNQIEDIEKDIRNQTSLINCILIDRHEDMFLKYDIEKELRDMSRTKIWLKNGGNLVINYTEAMTIIDVNSAKAVLTKNYRKAVTELNKLAVLESIYQIIKRNLYGIIIIDLVDMKDEKDRQAIYDYAKEVLKKEDNSISKVYPVSELGLLSIARNKRYTAFNDKVFTDCKACGNKYGMYTLEYLCFLIEQKLQHTAYHTLNKSVIIKCKKELIDYLYNSGIKMALTNYYHINMELREDNTLTNTFIYQYYEQ